MAIDTESVRLNAQGAWKLVESQAHQAINLLSGAKINIVNFRKMVNNSPEFDADDLAVVDARIQKLKNDVLEIVGAPQ